MLPGIKNLAVKKNTEIPVSSKSHFRKRQNNDFKGTQAWNNFDFFLPKSNPYVTLVNFARKKIASFPSILAGISKFEHFRGDWAYAEPIKHEQIKHEHLKDLMRQGGTGRDWRLEFDEELGEGTSCPWNFYFLTISC